MINLQERIITQLMSTIYKDKQNHTVLRVNVDNAVTILSNFGYNLPSNVFEKKLEDALNKKLVGAKMNPGLHFAVAQLIVDLANKMHVKEEDIANYLSSKASEEDVKDLQNQIINWRKEYYGSMDKSEKQALIDTLHNKLRPDVLEQIRRA
jgi:N-acetyl-anhydromuramyl-L-alanine amidase AmpD